MALKRLIFIAIFVIIFCANALAENIILGFYAFPNKHFVDLITGTQFKYLIAYGTDGQKDEKYLKDFLTYAETKNVNIIFSLKDCYKTSKWYPTIDWCDTNDEKRLVKCIVTTVDNYKAVAGYYLADDATDTIGNKNLQLYKTNVHNIKNISNKPIFVQDYPYPGGKLLDVFSETADYLIVSSYPIPEEDPGKVYNAIKTVVERYGIPVIAVVQAHGKYQYPFYKRDAITGRPPTLDELRIMSYLVIMAGAKGIIYYSLFDIEKLPDGKDRLTFLISLAKELDYVFKIVNANATKR